MFLYLYIRITCISGEGPKSKPATNSVTSTGRLGDLQVISHVPIVIVPMHIFVVLSNSPEHCWHFILFTDMFVLDATAAKSDKRPTKPPLQYATSEN